MSKGIREGTVTDTVRQYASVKKTIRKKELRDVLGLSPNQITSSIRNLCVQGYLKRVEHGSYEFNEVLTKHSSNVEELIWRAVKVNQTFTASVIARQSGSTIAYIYKIFRQLRSQGFIRQYGRKPAIDGGFEKVWRLTHKGKEKSEKPNEVKFKPDQLIEETVTLNKLICSGLVKLDESAAIQAVQLCESIKQQLKNDLISS